MGICTHCGTTIGHEDRFCAACAEHLPVENAPDRVHPVEPDNPRTLPTATDRGPAETVDGPSQTPGRARDTGSAGDMVGKTLLDQFEVVRKIGQGTFGDVYLAEQRGVERRAVVKVLHRRLAADPAAVKRFRHEAKSLARLDHHHLVKLYNAGELEGGVPFLVMEYGGDRTLASVLEEQRALPPTRVCRIGEQICEALAEAHARRIVHRDLKPANILVSQKDGADWVKVVDVGIAKLLQPDEEKGDVSALTREGSIVGTPAYFSPEQSGGRAQIDGRSDLYSLGVVLYEAACGERPFRGATLGDYVRAHASHKPQSLRSKGVAAPALESVILRALEKDPDRRFADALQMRDALRLAAQAPARPRPRIVLLAAVVAGAVAAPGVAIAWRSHRGSSRLQPVAVAPAAPAPPERATQPPPSEETGAKLAQSRTAPAQPPKEVPVPAASAAVHAGTAAPRTKSTAHIAQPPVVAPSMWGRLTVKAPATSMSAGSEWRSRPDGGELDLAGDSGVANLATADAAWTVRILWGRRKGDRLGLVLQTTPVSIASQEDEPLGTTGEVMLEPGSPTRIAFRSPAREQDLVLILRLSSLAPEP